MFDSDKGFPTSVRSMSSMGTSSWYVTADPGCRVLEISGYLSVKEGNSKENG
jgi:hypothetical protein